MKLYNDTDHEITLVWVDSGATACVSPGGWFEPIYGLYGDIRIKIGTPNGTSVEPDSSDPQNAGNKPENDQMVRVRRTEDYPHISFG